MNNEMSDRSVSYLAMDAYLKALIELRSVDADIARLQERRAELQRFVAMGQKLFPRDTTGEEAMQLPLAQAIAAGSYRRAPQTRSQLMTAVEQHLLNHGPTSTRDLVNILEEQGIEIPGVDKHNMLSVLMSRSGRYITDRRSGWSIVREDSEEARTTRYMSTGRRPED